ncbi:RNase A-like domain-containing protein [Acetobacter papayae]|uniref:RNase A-like domain-containing protein n=1 Tax=Acetobacter papayae TaxID=1076592 RepID=UPI0039ED6752
MQTTHRQPALTFVMTERQLVNIVRPYLPSQKSINKAEGLLTIGLGMAEVAGGAALLGSPEPILSKVGGVALTAHGIDMVTAGQRAWRTGTASETRTERMARAAAQKAHAPPAVVNLVGMAADAMLPDGIIHAAAHFGATRALRVAAADASRLSFKNDNITPEHFPRPSPQTAQPVKIPEKEVLLYPHRQETLDLHHHEAPPHNRKLGGHVLLKHVNPSQAYIDRRFEKEKHEFLSYFTTKEAAEREIHRAIKANSTHIDSWLANANVGAIMKVKAKISGSEAVVISKNTRQKKHATNIEVRIKKQTLNGMIYHIFSVTMD